MYLYNNTQYTYLDYNELKQEREMLLNQAEEKNKFNRRYKNNQ